MQSTYVEGRIFLTKYIPPDYGTICIICVFYFTF